MKEIKELTGLRFIAAFYVFIFHLQLRNLLPDLGRFFNNFIRQGTLGVSVFFILSGLVLTYSHMGYGKNKESILYFMSKRLSRIGPVFLAGLIVALLSTAMFHNPPQNFIPIFLLDITLLNAWVPPLAMKWYGGGSWSVSCEIFFYLVFPLLLPRLIKLKQSALMVLLAGVVVVSALPGLARAYFPNFASFNWVYSFPPARLPEFVVGMLVALLVFRFNWTHPAAVTLGAAIVLTVYLAWFGSKLPGYVSHNFLTVPCVICLVTGLCRDAPYLLRWLGSPLFNYLGRISYGFYIWQLVMFLVVDTLLERHQMRPYSVSTSVALFSINLVMAIISYHFIETRAHASLQARLRLKPVLQ